MTESHRHTFVTKANRHKFCDDTKPSLISDGIRFPSLFTDGIKYSSLFCDGNVIRHKIILIWEIYSSIFSDGMVTTYLSVTKFCHKNNLKSVTNYLCSLLSQICHNFLSPDCHNSVTKFSQTISLDFCDGNIFRHKFRH